MSELVQFIHNNKNNRVIVIDIKNSLRITCPQCGNKTEFLEVAEEDATGEQHWGFAIRYN